MCIHTNSLLVYTVDRHRGLHTIWNLYSHPIPPPANRLIGSSAFGSIQMSSLSPLLLISLIPTVFCSSTPITLSFIFLSLYILSIYSFCFLESALYETVSCSNSLLCSLKLSSSQMTNFMLFLFSPTLSTRSAPPSPSQPKRSSSQTHLIPDSTSSSDNEISSLYGKYRHSANSLSGNFDPHSQDDNREDSGHPVAAHQPHDLNSPPATQWPGVIDELQWMLGEAIDSAQSTFGDPKQSHRHSPSISNLSSYSNPSIDFENTPSLEKQIDPGSSDQLDSVEPSKEDLSESDYSDCVNEDGKEVIDQKSSHADVFVPSSSSVVQNESDTTSADPLNEEDFPSCHMLRRYPVQSVTGLIKLPTDKLPQDCSMIPLSHKESIDTYHLDGAQTVCSEEVSTPSTSQSHAPLSRRSPSLKFDNFISRKYKDLVSLRKREATLDSPPPGPSDPQTPTPVTSAVLPSQEATPMNSPMMNNMSKSATDTTFRDLPEDEHLKSIKSPGSAAKSLMARSAVVKRSSSDMSFLEQWQWLESQHPSSRTSPPTKNPALNSISELKPSRIPNLREIYLRNLNDHFTSSNSLKDYLYKRALLSQIQENHTQSRLRPNGNKSTKTLKPTSPWFHGVPTINPKELKKVKAPKDRCRIYEAKLQQLFHQPSGLDLWVWLRTRAETQTISPSQAYTKFTTRFQATDSTRAAPSIGLHQPTELQRASRAFPVNMRDLSISSVASFPLRDGGISHKAIQIQGSGEKNLVEIVRPEGPGHRPNGMVVNSLMEVNNLPYPSLYPHSTVQNHGFTQAGPEKPRQHGSPTKSISSVSSKLAYEPSTRSTTSFFSQLTRQNSSKRRNEGGRQSHSPSKNSLKISAALISAPMAGPKGPRPDNGMMSNFSKPLQDTGDLVCSSAQRNVHQVQRIQPDSVGSTPPQEVNHRETEELNSPTRNEQMSSAHSTNSRQFSQREPNPHHSLGSGSIGPIKRNDYPLGGEISRKQSTSEESQQSQHYPPVPKTPSTSQPRFDLNHHQDEFKQKVEKLMDVLPQADRGLLEKILIDSNFNDVIAIGTYLELTQVKRAQN